MRLLLQLLLLQKYPFQFFLHLMQLQQKEFIFLGNLLVVASSV